MQCACATLSPVACPALQCVSAVSHKRRDFLKNVIDREMCVLIFSTTVSETRLILRGIKRDLITDIQACWSASCKVRLFLSYFNEN